MAVEYEVWARHHSYSETGYFMVNGFLLPFLTSGHHITATSAGCGLQVAGRDTGCILGGWYQSYHGKGHGLKQKS